MKNALLGLLLLGFMSTGQSQILLEEANVIAKKPTMKIDVRTNALVVQIPEKVIGEFQKDPVRFVRNNFDSAQLALDNKDSEYDSYEINFRSTKGHLLARFDDKGEIISTFQKFRDVALPEAARTQINQKYGNCKFLSNVYVGKTKKWDMKKEFYRVKIMDEQKVRRLKVNKYPDKIVIAGM